MTGLTVVALMIAAMAATYIFSGGRWPLGGDTIAQPGTRPTAAPSVIEEPSVPVEEPSLQPTEPTAQPSTGPSPRVSVRPSVAPTPKPTPSPTSPKPSASPSKPVPTPTSTMSAADAAEVVRLTNIERRKAGCKDLTAQSQLRRAAQLHSEWQSANGLGHKGAGGSQPGDRATAAGYSWTRIGENVAHGYRSPEAVVEAWMFSTAHKANITNCAYTHLGVGVAAGAEGIFWTQLFGA